MLSADKFGIASKKLAFQKPASENIKAFAELMIADDTKVGEELWKTSFSRGGAPKAAATNSRLL